MNKLAFVQRNLGRIWSRNLLRRDREGAHGVLWPLVSGLRATQEEGCSNSCTGWLIPGLIARVAALWLLEVYLHWGYKEERNEVLPHLECRKV